MTSILPAGTLTFLCADTLTAFDSADEAAKAALDLRSADCNMRVALHTGEAHVRDDGVYVGPAVRRVKQLRELAHDGQTLVSAATAAVLGELPEKAFLEGQGAHRLRDLARPERIFELCSPGANPHERPSCSLDAVRNNLPVHLSGFVGREDEIAAVRTLLADGGLVTLTGPGGSGKTRLAAQVAAAADRPDGVWWIELDAVTERAQVADRVAATLDLLVQPQLGAARSVADALRDKRVLVCLDNCEQVLDGAADIALELLRSCPEVAVLATSREPLGVPGESVWRVPPLATAQALELFVERAGAVRPWFALDTSSEVAVRTLCERLDGIPLAIELAAAWLQTLTPQQIVAGLEDRFALLVRGPRGVPARQQTLEASIAWSYDLLDGADREIFARLSVFASGFDLQAARAVCGGDVLAALGRLVDKSLIVAEDGRYRLLETIREFARGKQRDTADLRDRHLGHYLAVAEAAEPELESDKDGWVHHLEPERDNLRTALDWGLSADDPDRGRRLAAAVWWLWNLQGRGHEGLGYLRKAVARAPEDRSRLQARLYTGIGLVADTTAPFDAEAARLGLEIATELGDDGLRARCLCLRGVERLYFDLEAATSFACEAEKAAEAAGDEYARDCALVLRGILLALRDRHEDARPLLTTAAASLAIRGDRGIASTAFVTLSASALVTGDVAEARRLAARAVETAEPLGDFHRVGTARFQLASVLCVLGDVEGALELMEPFLRLVESAETDVFIPGMPRVMGELHRCRGEYTEAVRWFRGELAPPGSCLEASGLPGLGGALRALGRADEAREVLAKAVDLARRWDLPSTLADALDQQGHLAEPVEALELHHQALAVRLENGLRLGYPASLDALAPLLDDDSAARALAASDQARQEMGCPRRPGEQAALERFARADEPAALDDVVAFVRRTRGQRGRPSAGWGSLTPTELEVVRLAVEGCTNPEIAGRLFMSRGTVKTHLAHVYAKLGVANRTELATAAADHLRTR